MVRGIILSALVGALSVGCGGSGKKEADEPDVEADGEEDWSAADDGDDLIPPDKLDEVERFFDRKARTISRCWVEALDAGEVKANERGVLTVWLTIQPSGKPKGVRIENARPRSETLESCVLGRVESWQLPTLPEEMEYAYQFAFEQL